jgi:hypothetical protein
MNVYMSIKVRSKLSLNFTIFPENLYRNPKFLNAEEFLLLSIYIMYSLASHNLLFIR